LRGIAGDPTPGQGLTNAWFVSLSKESFGNTRGFLAAAVFEDNIPYLDQALHIDMTQWHDYGIVWTRRGVTFSVDGEVVAFSPLAPSGPLGFTTWIDTINLLPTSRIVEIEQDQSLLVASRGEDAEPEAREPRCCAAWPTRAVQSAADSRP
jgi:hypothetical protein